MFYGNCSAHPQELISSCGNIMCHCLPPNTTGALQLMDQGSISHVKETYKIKSTNNALRQMDKNTVIGNMFNKFTIKDVIDNFSLDLKVLDNFNEQLSVKVLNEKNSLHYIHF